MAAYEVLLLNTSIPQIQAAQTGDTYVVPRDIAINATATITGNVGIGTTSPGDALEVVGSGAAGIRVSRSGASSQYVTISSGSTGPTINASTGINELSMGVNGTRAMLINSSGNVGIGTTNPSASVRLTVAKDDGIIQIQRATGTAYPFSFGIASDGRFNIYDGTAAAERLAITQAGNLGLGVTPNTWASGFRALQVGTGIYSSVVTSSDSTYLASNWYYDGAEKYIANGFASFYRQNAGQHIWYRAANNTSGAGASLSPSQAMTLDASGNLKIGGTADRATTAGTNHLDIFNGTAPVGTLTNGISIYSSSGEAYVMDAAGNATLFSPHDAETNEWIFKSKHTPTGKVLKIDVERLLKFVNDHFGLDAVHEFVEE